MKPQIIFYSLLLAIFTTVSVVNAQPRVEQANADIVPWSGYWWPMRHGEIVKPLTKYDQIAKSKAAAWERANNPSGPRVPQWYGYCHAWAASSITEKEPRKPIKVDGQQLSVGDQKGLLAVSHANDVSNSYGDRFGDGVGSESKSDLTPDHLWMLLRRYIKQQKLPLVLDIDAGAAVWNYPVFAYKVTYDRKSDGQTNGTIEIWLADDAVPKNYVGTKRAYQKYSFTCKMTERDSVIMGTGKWTGASVRKHPDFAWFPFVTRPENPEVSYKKVCSILGNAAPTPPAQPASPTPPTANVTPPEDTSATPNNPTPTASGAVAIKPEELLKLIANQTSDFAFDISVDRFDGGKYEEGDTVVVSGTSEKEGYLYLFAVGTQGELSLIYPQPGDNNQVKAKKQFMVPKTNASYQVSLHPPYGNYRIKGMVTQKPLQFAGVTVAPPAPNPEQEKIKPTQQRPLGNLQFQWQAPQKQRMTKSLKEYNRRGIVVESVKVPENDALKALRPFAQDSVTFYVGPKRK